MQRIETDRQFKGELLILLLATGLVSSVALRHAWDALGMVVSSETRFICGIVPFVPPLISMGLWALRNQMNRGIKYAWKHYRLVLRLRKQLLDTGIYTEIKFGALKLAKIPRIVVDFSPDFKTGTLHIENSIQFNEKLAKINISPSLGKYVVEQTYLSDDMNRYRFDFYDSSIERRLVFDSFREFKACSKLIGQYELFIDDYTTLTLTHQLIVGQTGSGKSYALHGYLLQMLLKPIKYHLYFADPKGSSIALLGEWISPDTTANDFEGIVNLLETFVAQMQKRQQEMKKYLAQKIDGDYRDFGLSPHVLIFDEFADFSLLLQTKDKKQRDYVNSLISQIVLKGRQSGFFLWIVMQQSGSNNIPTYVRDNLPCKVVLGNAEDQTYITAFGVGTDIPLREMEIGEGVYTYPSVANKPKLCAFPSFGFDVLQTLEAGVM